MEICCYLVPIIHIFPLSQGLSTNVMRRANAKAQTLNRSTEKKWKYFLCSISFTGVKDIASAEIGFPVCYVSVSVSAHREHSSLQTTQKISAKLVELPKNGNQEIDLFVRHFQKFSSKLMNPRRSIMIHP